MKKKIPLLILNRLSLLHQYQISQKYDVIYAPTPNERLAAIIGEGEHFRAVLTIGAAGLSEEEIEQLPNLELVCAMGAGYESIAIDFAESKGIALAHGPGTNSESVADHAMGLLISLVRGLPQLDRLCRSGVWNDEICTPASIFGKRLGILGLGRIGEKIAKRAEAFGMSIGYHNRNRRLDSPYQYFDDIRSMAAWCEILVVAAPGGRATQHLVGSAELHALGVNGYLINISRGSLVDTKALAKALGDHRIAGAGLDVYEGEPNRPDLLIGLENVILSPHVAGWSPEATQASVTRFLENADGHFSGKGVIAAIKSGTRND